MQGLQEEGQEVRSGMKMEPPDLSGPSPSESQIGKDPLGPHPVGPSTLPDLSWVKQEACEGLKEEILEEEEEDTGVLEMWRHHFRHFCYQEVEGPRETCRQLQELCHQWLKPNTHTKEQMVEMVILEQFLTLLPREMQSWVCQNGPVTCAQAVSLAEGFLSRLQETEISEQKASGPLEEAFANSSRSEQDPSDTMEIQISMETKEEVKEEAGILLDKMSPKRKSYSIEYKKSIVEESCGKNLTAYCQEKQLDLRLVRKWRADYDALSQQVGMGNGKKRKCGSGRQTLFPHLEDITCEWIADRRSKALVVRRADIQAFALAMAPMLDISPEDFRASQHWLDNFLRRYELSLRRSTTLLKLEDADVVQRALDFKSLVDGIDFSKYQLSNMIAMDETAVFLGQGSQATINQSGASSIYLPSTGYESARVTCILAIRLDGKKVTPLIITKGKKDKIERVSGIYVLETEKAWCTQAAIRQWVDLTLPLNLRGGQRGLLVWDSASSHRAKGMKSFLAGRRIDQVMIPAGMTAYLQTLDIAIKTPFKDYLHTESYDFIENRTERNQRGDLVKPGLQEMVTWVKNSWAKITDSCVSNALQAGYLDKRCSFKESSIARDERLGSMVLKEMALQENQARIRDLESYDDVPEEDDMTVFE